MPNFFTGLDSIFMTILDFLKSVDWISIFNTLRIIFVILDVILIWAFIYVFFQALKCRPKFLPLHYVRRGIEKELIDKKEFKNRWEKILERVYSGRPEARLVAIIEADKMADDLLKNMGFIGEHMADRLMQISKEELKTLDKLWEAHKIRNDLVHTPGFEISESHAKDVLRNYRDFFEEVKVI